MQGDLRVAAHASYSTKPFVAAHFSADTAEGKQITFALFMATRWDAAQGNSDSTFV